MAGAAFGNTCYPALNLATDAYFQSIAPAVLASGVTVSYENIAGVWNRVETKANGNQTISVAPLPSLAACDPMAGFNDGLTVASLMVLALVSASLYGIVARAK
jgi:hypothetical protein